MCLEHDMGNASGIGGLAHGTCTVHGSTIHMDKGPIIRMDDGSTVRVDDGSVVCTDEADDGMDIRTDACSVRTDAR